MKRFIFLPLLTFSVIVHAEKAASPVLLAPTDAAKNIVKDNIAFRWQKSTNETAAQVLGYRLLISENSRFSGYAIKDGTCNSSCTVAVVNNATPTYTASMAQPQNVYFWKVQAIGAMSKSAWSRVNSFKTETPIPVPKLTQITATPTSIVKGNALTFTATLTGVLPKNYSVKVNYGNGLISMSGAGTNYTLSVTPTSTGSLLYSVGIYDSINTLNGNAMTGNFEIREPAPVVIETPKPVVIVPPVFTKPTEIISGTKTFSYTKIANNGSLLSDSAKLGTGSTDWACTQDNKTGLIWEVKTTDGGLRDSSKTYTNYTADYPKCDWSGCEKDFKGKYGDSTNTDGFVTAVNNQSLCGNSDWRLPTDEELKGLVYCSDGKYNTLTEDFYICSSNGAPNYKLTTTSPTINAAYFPNTQKNWFWSSSPLADVSNGAWHVYFYYGGSSYNYKSSSNYVRLVR